MEMVVSAGEMTQRCVTRADQAEDATGPLRPRCNDGVDNDDDGDTDLEDIHCQSRDDLTEAQTPFEIELNPVLSECGDGLDNDETDESIGLMTLTVRVEETSAKKEVPTLYFDRSIRAYSKSVC